MIKRNNNPPSWFAMRRANTQECQLIFNMDWLVVLYVILFYCFISYIFFSQLKQNGCFVMLFAKFTIKNFNMSEYIPFVSYRKCCKHKVSSQYPWAWSPSLLSHNTSYQQVQFARSAPNKLQYSLIQMPYHLEDPWEILWQVSQEESPRCKEEMQCNMPHLNV